jgi:alpha-glucosidase
MEDVLRFWLDRGVDGFRVDVAHGLGKDPALPDLPPELADRVAADVNDDPSTHGIFARLRRLVDGYPGDRVLVGEVFLLDTAQVATYYGTPIRPELHLGFNFPPLRAPWDAGVWRQRIAEVVRELDPRQAWPTWVLSNHDNPRHRTRYGSDTRARAAAVLLLSLRGTPFLYAGEELGLEDAVVGPEQAVDPGGRDGCRAPLPWDPSLSHGWAGGPRAWLPWPPGADQGRDVASLRADPGSIVHLYRRLLALRRSSAALRDGTFRLLDTPPPVLGYLRHHGDDRRVVLINFGAAIQPVPLADGGSWRVEVSSDGHLEGVVWGDEALLEADQAVILAPAP